MSGRLSAILIAFGLVVIGLYPASAAAQARACINFNFTSSRNVDQLLLGSGFGDLKDEIATVTKDQVLVNVTVNSLGRSKALSSQECASLSAIATMETDLNVVRAGGSPTTFTYERIIGAEQVIPTRSGDFTLLLKAQASRCPFSPQRMGALTAVLAYYGRDRTQRRANTNWSRALERLTRMDGWDSCSGNYTTDLYFLAFKIWKDAKS